MDKAGDLTAGVTVDDLIRVIGKQTIRINELEAELTSRCTRQDKRANVNIPSHGRIHPDIHQNVSQAPHISAHLYDSLSQRHAELLARHERLEARFANREKKYREAKDAIKAWKVYVDRKFPPSSHSETTANPPGDESGSNGDTVSRHASADAESLHAACQLPDPDAPTKDAAAYELPIDTPPNPRSYKTEVKDDATKSNIQNVQSKQVTSSQTTEETDNREDNSRVAIKREPSSDDIPVVVSSRQLKRKASQPNHNRSARRVKQEPVSSSEGIEVRSEDYSSPQAPPRALHDCQSSDLDAIWPQLKTPRRPRSGLHVDRRAVSEDTARLRPNLPTKRSSSDDEGRSSIRVPKSNMADARSSINHARKATASSRISAHRQSRHSGSPYNNALQEISVNVPTARSGIRRATNATMQKRNRAINRIGALAEGGESVGSQTMNDDAKRSDEGYVKPEGPADARLHALLADHTSAKTPLAPEAVPYAANSSMQKSAGAERSPVDTADKVAPSAQHDRRHRTPERRPRRQHVSTPSAQRREPRTPLRDKPLSALRLEDFKINAAHRGTDFAFVEDSAVRGRQQRHSLLQACTRPDCCGATFRRVVEAGGTSVSGKSDAAALEEHLGPRWAEVMRTYDAARQRDVLVDAHVQSFARQHGRHRHAFQRRSTPPGFWRTDMPTSQEAADDRRRAREVERQKVEERWREALRDGGGWRFRDE